MNKLLFPILLLILVSIHSSVRAQDFVKYIARHREEYEADFLKMSNSPLKKADLNYLRFFEPD